MNPERIAPLDERAQRALDELQGLVQQHYPGARFYVERGLDEPAAIHLVTTVDVEDPDVVLDVVLERMMEIQIEEMLPIFVIPIRTPERVAELRRQQASRKAVAAGHAPLQP